MDPLFWLYQDNFRTYNVEVAKKIGSINAAIYLSELAQRFKYHSDRDELITDEKMGDGWFYYTMEKCEERTALSVKEQRNAQNLLSRLGLIETANFGVPCKKHFKVCEENIMEFFGFSNNKSRCAKRANWMCQKGKLDVPKGQTAHIYKDTEEENDNDNDNEFEEVVVAVVSNSHKKEKGDPLLQQKKIDNAWKGLRDKLTSASEECGKQWDISEDVLRKLIKKHGIFYVLDQVKYMFCIQLKALHDEKVINKPHKVKKIDNPESYLKLACEKNYCASESSS